MSTMDQDQDQKHVCRYCNKSFSSGKVLGGHMRCHGTKNSEKKKLIINNKSEKNGERSGYGLRVNPKKSSRLSGGCSSNYDDHDLELSSGQDIFCQVCGKGFDSMRALFGHMRHHSGQRRKEEVHCKECGREFESSRALTGHMKSHSEKRFLGVVSREKLFGETSRLVRKKRSRRLLRRYKISPNCSSFSNLSDSSSGGGVELDHDQELEEAALCLLMLSRGVHFRDEFCFPEKNESSPFEGNSPNRIVTENGGGWIRVVKKPRLEKLELFDEKKVPEFSENDFGLQSDDDEEEKTAASFEASVHDDDDDDDVDEIEKESQDGMGLINSDEVEFDENQREVLVSGLINLGPETFDNSHSSRRSEYKCRTCNKIFHSHQALGGHQTIHRSSKNNNFPAFQFDAPAASPSPSSDVFSGIEAKYNEKNSMEVVMVEMDKVTMTTSYETSNNNKEHKCPICFKVFGSGQALGGHKRAHIVKDSEVDTDQITLMKQEVCNMSDVLGDLSVSVIVGNEPNSWWVKSDLTHEVLVGLMPK